MLSAAGASSLSSVVNSSSEKSSRQAALSTGWVRIASSENSIGTLVWMVTRSFESRILSRLFCNDSRYVFLDGFGRGNRASSAASTRAELLDQFDRAFVADARRAGDVVDRVAAQRHHIDDALGRHAETRLDAGGIEQRLSLVGLRMRPRP